MFRGPAPAPDESLVGSRVSFSPGRRCPVCPRERRPRRSRVRARPGPGASPGRASRHHAAADIGIRRRVGSGVVEIGMSLGMRIDRHVPLAAQYFEHADMNEMAVGENDAGWAAASAEAGPCSIGGSRDRSRTPRHRSRPIVHRPRPASRRTRHWRSRAGDRRHRARSRARRRHAGRPLHGLGRAASLLH